MQAIPIASPLIGEEEVDAVIGVLKSGRLAQGPKVEELEREFSKYIGTKYAVACNSGTAALHIALLALGIKAGDETITTPFSFVASSNCALYCGAKPVFADIDSKTYNIDPKEIHKKVTTKTRAIIPVHLYGQPAEMKEIMEIAEKYSLSVIEDACQAHGAEYHGKRVGGIGDVGCFSFYPTKNMVSAEGGIITTDDGELAEKMRILRDQGQKPRYNYVMLGFNLRMNELQAAIATEQLKKLDGFIEKRRANAAFLSQELGNVAGISIPHVANGVKHVFHQYTIRVKNRDAVKESILNRGVGSEVYYPVPIHKQPIYREYHSLMLPEAEAAAKEVLSIPVHPKVSTKDLKMIADSLREVTSDV